MPMAVFDGPHFSRRNLTRWLRRGRELLLGGHGDSLRLRRSDSNGRTGLLRPGQRLRQNVSTCRSDGHTAGSG